MKSILSTLDALIEQIVSTIATRLYAFNGTTWDRVRSTGGESKAILSSIGLYGALVDNWTGAVIMPYRENGGYTYGMAVFPVLYNNTNYDRLRNNYEVTALASAARTIATNSADLVNFNARGVIVVIDVTAVTGTPSLTVTIKSKDTLSGKYVSILVSAALTAVGTTTLIVYPGIAAAANSKADQPLTRVWCVEVAVANADSVTYSIGANYIN